MPPTKIIAFGDSITYGYPFGHRYSWVELLSQKLNMPFINSGANGDTFRSMAHRLLVDVIDQHPDYVIVLGGANDVYQGLKTGQITPFLEKILQILIENKIQPILCLPTPIEDPAFEEQLNTLRSFIKKQAKKLKLPLINFYDPFLDPKKKKKKAAPGLLEDGVHPSVTGYQLMSEVAYRAVQKILKAIPKTDT